MGLRAKQRRCSQFHEGYFRHRPASIRGRRSRQSRRASPMKLRAGVRRSESRSPNPERSEGSPGQPL